MALDSLTALANTGSGTDLLGGRTIGGKFVGAAMLTDETGAEISAANPLDVTMSALKAEEYRLAMLQDDEDALILIMAAA